MRIFESLGEGAERFKQKVTGDTRYECLSCESVFGQDHETCPDCNSEAVVPAV